MHSRAARFGSSLCRRTDGAGTISPASSPTLATPTAMGEEVFRPNLSGLSDEDSVVLPVSNVTPYLDTALAASWGLRSQPSSANAGHKAPLAPKQGLGGTLASQRAQHQSPISGTYALRTPRGKITSIACESCRKRKSKVSLFITILVKSILTKRFSAMASDRNAIRARRKTSHVYMTSRKTVRPPPSCEHTFDG